MKKICYLCILVIVMLDLKLNMLDAKNNNVKLGFLYEIICDDRLHVKILAYL